MDKNELQALENDLSYMLTSVRRKIAQLEEEGYLNENKTQKLERDSNTLEELKKWLKQEKKALILRKISDIEKGE